MANGFRDRYDVVIAGARCAGAATALLLARHGVRVLVVDPLPRGRDTLSTHALMRGGVMQLRLWGLLDSIVAAGTPAVHATTFDYGDEIVTIPIKPRDGVDALFAPRRTVLDPVLLDAAVAAGAEVVHGVSVVDLVRGAHDRVEGARIGGGAGRAAVVRAGLVVGADGARSRVARVLRTPIVEATPHAAACVFGYWNGLTRSDYRWGFRPGVSTGAIPTNGGDTCVFVSLPAEQFADVLHDGLETVFHRSLRAADPELADDIARARPSSLLRAFAGMQGVLRQAAGPGWALVGDAGYFRDPITAHGITDAFRDAELLARAVLQGHEGALHEYQAQRDGVARDVMRISDRVASFAWTIDEIKELHQDLSRAMNAGVELLRGLPDGGAVAGAREAGGSRLAAL